MKKMKKTLNSIAYDECATAIRRLLCKEKV